MTTTLGAFTDYTVLRLARVKPHPRTFERAPSPCSLFSGAAGLAFFFHEAARLRDQPVLIERAARWCEVAERLVPRRRAQAWGPREGFLDGRVGVAYVRILVSEALDDPTGLTRGLEHLERSWKALSSLRSPPTELFHGIAGFVCAAADLLARLSPSRSAARERLHHLGEAACARLRDRMSRSLENNDLIGMAHGRAGEVWALLRWERGAEGVLRKQLTELASLACPYDGGRLWPHRLGVPIGAPARWWCHGVPGHTMLWTEVAERTPRRDAGRLARSAASATFALPAETPILCCGLAGQALVLARFGRSMSDARFTRRSLVRLRKAIASCGVRDATPQPMGLWQGVPGVALVAMMRLAGEAFFPCLESPR